MRTYEDQGKPIIYLDESGFAHDAPRTHGYAVVGERCFGTHDWGAKGRTNAIGALMDHQLITASLFNGTINGTVFHEWMIQDCLPKAPKGAVIVMDNAAFHKRSDTQKAIIDAGCILEYLPPYSPDLNPIEHKWAQAKAIRRKYNVDDIDRLFKAHLMCSTDIPHIFLTFYHFSLSLSILQSTNYAG